MAAPNRQMYPFYPREAPLELGEGRKAYLIAPRVSYYVSTRTAQWLCGPKRLPRHGHERRVDAAGRTWWLGRTRAATMTVWHIRPCADDGHRFGGK